MMKIFQIALESELDDVIADQDMIVVDAETMEEANGGIEENTDALADACTVVAAMEQLSEVVGRFTNDQMTQGEADVINIALEQFYSTLGVSRPQELSMEDATETSANNTAATIRDHAVRILKAILDALEKLFQMVSQYIQQITGAAARLQKYAIELDRAQRNILGNPNTKNYTSASMGRRMYVPSGSSHSKALMEVVELCVDAAKSAMGDQVQLINRALSAYASGAPVSELIEKIPPALEKAYSGIFPNTPTPDDFTDNTEGVTVFTTNMMLGGYVGVLIMPDTTDYLSRLQFSIQQLEGLKFTDQVPVADKTEMGHLLNQSQQICSLVRQFEKSTQPRLNGMIQNLRMTINRVKAMDHQVSPEDMKFLRTLASSAPSIARGIHQRCFGFGLQSVRSALQHVKTSMTYYGEKK